MARKPEDGHDAFGIARVGKRKWGYDVAQVDAFLKRAHSLYESDGMQLTPKDIQGASFDMRRGGYQYKQVDAALDRLERAVVDKQTAWEIANNGRVVSKARSERLLEQIVAHANRAEGQRFAPGRGKAPSYDRKQVDHLIDRIVAYASSQLHGDASQGSASDDVQFVDSNTIAHAIFTQRKGSKGYDERQVDYFLAACAHLLTRLESFARVSNYEEPAAAGASVQPQAVPSGDATHENDGRTPVQPQPLQEPTRDTNNANAGQQTEIIGVPPLFSADSGRRTPPSYAPESGDKDQGTSFDELHKAEQAIFTPASETNAPSVEVLGTRDDGDGQVKSDSQVIQSQPAPEPVPDALSDEYERRTPPAPVTSSAKILDGASDDPDHGAPASEEIHETQVESMNSASPQTGVVGNGIDATGIDDTGDGASSLSALAHLAEVTHDAPIPSTKPENPKVPSLSDFSMPGAVTDAGRSHETDQHAKQHAEGHDDKSDALFPSTIGGSQDDIDLNIPDLSFPVFASDDDSKHSDDGRDAANQ